MKFYTKQFTLSETPLHLYHPVTLTRRFDDCQDKTYVTFYQLEFNLMWLKAQDMFKLYTKFLVSLNFFSRLQDETWSHAFFEKIPFKKGFFYRDANKILLNQISSLTPLLARLIFLMNYEQKKYLALCFHRRERCFL